MSKKIGSQHVAPYTQKTKITYYKLKIKRTSLNLRIESIAYNKLWIIHFVMYLDFTYLFTRCLVFFFTSIWMSDIFFFTIELLQALLIRFSLFFACYKIFNNFDFVPFVVFFCCWNFMLWKLHEKFIFVFLASYR